MRRILIFKSLIIIFQLFCSNQIIGLNRTNRDTILWVKQIFVDYKSSKINYSDKAIQMKIKDNKFQIIEVDTSFIDPFPIFKQFLILDSSFYICYNIGENLKMVNVCSTILGKIGKTKFDNLIDIDNETNETNFSCRDKDTIIHNTKCFKIRLSNSSTAGWVTTELLIDKNSFLPVYISNIYCRRLNEKYSETVFIFWN